MTSTSLTRRQSTAILAVILVSYFMVILDNSVIFTGLPSLQAELGLSTGELAWVQDAYTLVFGGFLLLGARAGDILGRRRVFVVGLAIFATASLLISVAPAAWWLITARAVQGIGAAIVAPSALSLLTASFDGPARARAIAWYAAAAGIGASVGMLVGGAAATWFSWRAGFLINVPIGIAMIVLAPRVIRETPRVPGRFDVLGAATSTLGVGALVFALLHGSEAGWGDPVTLTAAVSAIVLLIVFVCAEARADQPIMPLRLFHSRPRAGAYLVRMLYLGAMVGFFYFTTQYLQDALGYSPLQAGAAFLPMTAVNFVVALAIPRLIARIGQSWTLLGGIALTLAGMFWLSAATPSVPYLLSVALPMVLVGAGQGLAFAPMTSMGVAGTTASDAGAASGLLNIFHQVGMSLGLGVLIAVSSASVGTTDAALPAAEFSTALRAAGVFLVVAMLLAVVAVMPSRRARMAAAPAAAHADVS